MVTHGDGAFSVQTSQPSGRLEVHSGAETFGAIGNSPVKCVVMKLAAIAPSVKPGRSAHSVEIDGGVTTHGKGVRPERTPLPSTRFASAVGSQTLGAGSTSSERGRGAWRGAEDRPREVRGFVERIFH